MPLLEGKHRAPVQPVRGGEELIVEEIRDGLVVQLTLRRHHQHLHLLIDAGAEAEVKGRGALAAGIDGALERVVGVILIQVVGLIQHAHAGVLQGRNGAEHIPQALHVIFQLAAAAAAVAVTLNISAIQRTAGDGRRF